MDKLRQRMTWATNFVSNMTANAGSRTSKRFELTEKCMGCIAHELNTAMRNAVGNPYQSHSIVKHYIMEVKSILRILKQSGICNKLGIGKRLIKAAETRFGTFYTVSERFIESDNDFLEIMDEKENHMVSFHFKSLHQFGIEGSTS